MPADSDDNFDLPPALKAELRRHHRREVAISADLDASILTEARLTITHNRSRRRTLRLAGAGAALAAAAAIAVAVFNPAFRGQSSQPQLVALPDDLNRDGRVDILDAFQLARSVRDARPSLHDVTGDGKTDQADVDAIAKLAVNVGGAS